jgi:hypothetical protein
LALPLPQRRKPTTFRPLTALLPESVGPELLFIETTDPGNDLYGTDSM